MSAFAAMGLAFLACLGVPSAASGVGARLTIVFGGAERPVPVFLHNPSSESLECDVRIRLFQAGSATALRRGESVWKRVVLPAGQTVFESAQIFFPTVSSETRFLVQWVSDNHRVLASAQVAVHPTRILAELGALADTTPIAVLDPARQIKPLLSRLGVDWVDLEQLELENYDGPLVILGPFSSPEQEPKDLARRLRARHKLPLAVVWIRPPAPPDARLSTTPITPSFYTVRIGKVTVTIAASELVADLPVNPLAQRNLVRLARLALHPQELGLPDLDSTH